MFNNGNDNFLEKLGFFPVNILDSMVNNSYGVFFYQRRYKWELDNIQAYLSFFKLNYIEDQIYSFPQPIHIKEHPQGFEIIDGQQRYITTKLILLAIYNIIINKYDKDTLGYDVNDQNVFNKINEILFKKDHNNKFLFQTKLSLSNGDQNKFNKFLDWFYETDEEDIKNYKFDEAEIKLRGKELVDDIQKQEHVNWTFGNKHYNNYHALKTQYKEEDLKVENKEDILAAIEKQISFCGNSIGFIAYNEMEDNFKNGRDVYLNNNEEIVKKYLKTKSSILSKYYEKLDQEEIEKYLINKITKQMTIVQYYSKILQLNEEKGLYILEYQIKGKDGKKNYDDFLKEAPIKYPLTIVGQGSNHKVKIFGKNE